MKMFLFFIFSVNMDHPRVCVGARARIVYYIECEWKIVFIAVGMCTMFQKYVID